MDELFLHFLWNYQKFAHFPLRLETGETISVLKQGSHNQNAGPDFLEAKISIEEVVWAGSVEIHHKASDWNHHGHEKDPAYDNVILHAVWINDQEIAYQSGSKMPTLLLSRFVEQNLEQEYNSYINQPKKILCETYLTDLPSIQKTFMIDHAIMDRLQSKSKIVLAIYNAVNNDWDETAYRLLGKNFGFSINKETFERLTVLLPFKTVCKHLNNPNQVYALIFGTAGFLDEVKDEYSLILKAEFNFLKNKYKLNTHLSRQNWKFSRMRPSNFPTVRLAQFATFLLSNKRLFSFFIEASDVKSKKKELDITPKGYWEKNYDFGKHLESGSNHLGEFSTENILINTSVPLLAAYAKHAGEEKYLEQAIAQLNDLKPERNNITKLWADIGLKAENATDSQALIQQYNEFCLKKRCLHCNIGVSILNR